MNERIKAILEQTDIPLFPLFPNSPPAWVASDYDMVKFAELIVKECAKVVNDTEYPYENQSYKNVWDSCCVWSASKLKEHFGVEE